MREYPPKVSTEIGIFWLEGLELDDDEESSNYGEYVGKYVLELK